MRNVHIALVSEQTIPNILAIHSGRPDRIIFISTAKMRDKKVTDAIVSSLRLHGLDYTGKKHAVEVVNQDSFDDCERKLKAVAQRVKDDQVTVNLTCGTKVMSMAAFSVFRGAGARLIYTPIPRNDYIVIDENPDTEPIHPLPLRLGVRSYITAYGINITNMQEAEVLKARAQRGRELSGWIVQNYARVENLLGALCFELNSNLARDKASFPLSMTYNPRTEEERHLLSMLGMTPGRITKTLNRLESCFLTGDWLSDYCYDVLRRLNVDDCVTGVELMDKNGNPNEFDVMFTKDNALYTIECKSLKQKGDKDADILYKIAALQDSFGLRVRSFLVSTSREQILDRRRNAIKDHVHRRARQCNAEVIHPDDIMGFGDWIRSKVRGL